MSLKELDHASNSASPILMRESKNFSAQLRALYENPLPSTRTGALYNAFSYPTKISPEVIALFIATHTRPGESVLDPFAGSGTTGLAALLCDCPTDMMRKMALEIGLDPQWGPRHAILQELSVLGAFVAQTMCHPPAPEAFEKAVSSLLRETEQVLKPLWAALDPQGQDGFIRHIVWSDVVKCPSCGGEHSYWDAALQREPLRMESYFTCPTCSFIGTWDECKRVSEEIFDSLLQRNVVAKKRVMACVYGQTGKTKWQRPPCPSDVETWQKVLDAKVPSSAPIHALQWGDLYRAGYHKGITHLHHIYTRRSFITFATLWENTSRYSAGMRDALRMLLLSYNSTHATLMTRVVIKNGENDLVLTGAQSGVLYVSGLPVEKNIMEGIRRKSKTFQQAFALVRPSQSKVRVTQGSSTTLMARSKSVDYVFTDPPFGAYIPYAEINQINEAWLGKVTPRQDEVIVSPAQKKNVADYGKLMGEVFREIERVLKPQAQATVVFHSAKADVWRVLCGAYEKAGLRLDATSVLDKIQSSFKQVVSTVSVKGDPLLLLSKQESAPSHAQNTKCHSTTIDDAEGVFIAILDRADDSSDESEREPTRLYSRFVTTCLEEGLQVTWDASTFYARLSQSKESRPLSCVAGRYD